MDHSPEVLNKFFEYCPGTGQLKNKIDRGASRKGQVVGRPDKKGYLRINFLGSSIPAHRAAWTIFYGSIPRGQIDHKNLNKSDNKIENLRIASNSQNAMNRKIGASNTSGYKGVYWNKWSKRWIAVVRKNGVYVFRKGFSCLEDAAKAAEIARRAAHHQFCNQG